MQANYTTLLTNIQRNRGEAPVIQLLNGVLKDATAKLASDIHFEPYPNRYRVRLRIDGLLSTLFETAIDCAAPLISRLKVMAELNIAERRLPQDGRFKITQAGRDIDFRVSTCPTLNGEKVVLRILDATQTQRDIGTLGLSKTDQQQLLAAIAQPQGLILVTGPTGSGKTVTLYSLLCKLDHEQLNISTVEDPIEINLAGINQVNVQPKIELTFSRTLRAFLRQDPDVIMLGEMRDHDTADIAIKAAQTGHLVLSTLHTNSAAETLTRLINMGIAPYNIASSVRLIIAQRLVRTLCPNCKKPATLTENIRKDQGLPNSCHSIFEANGCNKCHQGFLGRTGLYELLPISAALQQKILAQTPASDIAEFATQQGMVSLRQAGLQQVASGRISLGELNRVIST